MKHDCVQLSQYEYVWNSLGERTCKHILRYENGNLQEHITQLSAKYSASSRTHESARFRETALAEIIGDDFRASNLSAMVVGLAKAFYWQDMCLFGYDLSIRPPPVPVARNKPDVPGGYKNIRENCSARVSWKAISPLPPLIVSKSRSSALISGKAGKRMLSGSDMINSSFLDSTIMVLVVCVLVMLLCVMMVKNGRR